MRPSPGQFFLSLKILPLQSIISQRRLPVNSIFLLRRDQRLLPVIPACCQLRQRLRDNRRHVPCAGRFRRMMEAFEVLIFACELGMDFLCPKKSWMRSGTKLRSRAGGLSRRMSDSIAVP